MWIERFLTLLLVLVCSMGIYGQSGPDPNIPDADHECVRTCEWPPSPRKCSYVFTIEWFHTMSSACYDCPINVTDCERPGCIPLNGVPRPIITVNRQLPGPAIQVCEGDEIEVKVWNRLGNSEGTTIHWHGLHQRGTPYMDGATMITQCPISPQSSFTYNFEASPAGTHWWHSHSNLQRTDGVYGPLIIKQASQRDPNSNLYDYDLIENVVFVQNWIHAPTISNYATFPPTTGSTDDQIINGKGAFQGFINSQNETVYTPREVFNVVQGGRYRFRVIGNNICSSVISVQGHRLTVIATDGASVKPFVVDRIGIFSGESYDFVLTADNSVGNYWFRFYSPNPGCANVQSGLAIVRYEGAPEDEPLEEFLDEDDADAVYLNPQDPDEGGIPVTQLESTAPDDEQLLGEPDVQQYLVAGIHKVSRWNMFDKQDYPDPPGVSEFQRTIRQINHISFEIPPSPPLTQWEDLKDYEGFCEVDDDMHERCLQEYCTCTQRIKIELGKMVELIFVGEDLFGADHPMHIHGHSFRVVSTERPNAPSISIEEVMALDQAGNITRTLEGAVIKDTVNVKGGGFTIVRFIADNPGWWLFHCHKIFHLSDGMTFVLEVGEPSDVPPVPENFPRCGSWSPSATDYNDKPRKNGDVEVPVKLPKSRKKYRGN